MFRIEPNFNLGFIEATAGGQRLLISECQRMFDQIDESVQLTGIHCVLLDVEADHAKGEPLTDKLQLANRMVNDPTLSQTRFAYVATHGAEIDPVLEVLAKAKGFQGQRFDTRAEAIDWLTESRSPCRPAAASPGTRDEDENEDDDEDAPA
jgi:hypothetical protein